MNDVLFMMLMVGLFLSFVILALFIWGAKGGQFDDSNKMMDGLLFDSTEDLNDAIKKESKKEKSLDKKKAKKSKVYKKTLLKFNLDKKD